MEQKKCNLYARRVQLKPAGIVALFLYGKPYKDKVTQAWTNNNDFTMLEEYDLPEDINPSWKDKEPCEVELIINKKN